MTLNGKTSTDLVCQYSILDVAGWHDLCFAGECYGFHWGLLLWTSLCDRSPAPVWAGIGGGETCCGALDFKKKKNARVLVLMNLKYIKMAYNVSMS